MHDCSLNMQQRHFGPGPLPCFGGQDSGSDAPKRIGLSFHLFSCARGKTAKLRGHCFHSWKWRLQESHTFELQSCSKSQHRVAGSFSVHFGMIIGIDRQCEAWRQVLCPGTSWEEIRARAAQKASCGKHHKIR